MRDKASKAAIELLKVHFELCKPLLQEFAGVNDPYVVQRLYGIVWGACVKRTAVHKDIFRDLVQYVYGTIFDQESVYPDILLRDYARLIIERWLYEFSEDREFIDIEKVMPPYNSEPIPHVDPQEYWDDQNTSMRSIVLSMQIDHHDSPGLYGDFGRYVFQRALECFEDIDIVNLYHYAIQFIRDTLGYDDRLNQYDSSYRYYRYYRHETRKNERIGKKYQWIAFYNILARISDRHLVKENDEIPHLYTGAWQPFVRDFDPSLNRNLLMPNDIPKLIPRDYECDFLSLKPYPNIEMIRSWLQLKPDLFSDIHKLLFIKDAGDHCWTVLCHCDRLCNEMERDNQKSIHFASGRQNVNIDIESFFVNSRNLEQLKQHVESEQFNNGDVFPDISMCQLYNREYAWSTGYSDILREEWYDYQIESAEYHVVKHTIEMPKFYVAYDDIEDDLFSLAEQKYEEKIPNEIYHIPIMPSHTTFQWEEGYDASHDQSVSFDVPCKAIIDHFKLQQKQIDGYYYSDEDELVCFDGRLANMQTGFIIRSDYLKKFLDDTNLSLIWICTAEKQFFTAANSSDQEWSTWRGFLTWSNENVDGAIQFIGFGT